MNITLVQTGNERRNEIRRFVNSLNSQLNISYKNIQYIFIDQGDNEKVFLNLNSEIDFLYIKISLCSLSHARNIALQFVKGDYISFPDDDCWYPNTLLEQVFGKLQTNKMDGLTGRVINRDGIEYNRYPNDNTFLSRKNLCGASSIGMFLRFDKTLFFDENIGVGSPYELGSGEESDYLLSLIKREYQILFDKNISIFHPINVIKRDSTYLRKCYLYARGAGYVAKKHNLGYKEYMRILFRPVLGMIYNTIKCDWYMCRRSFVIFKGRIEGLLFNF